LAELEEHLTYKNAENKAKLRYIFIPDGLTGPPVDISSEESTFSKWGVGPPYPPTTGVL